MDDIKLLTKYFVPLKCQCHKFVTPSLRLIFFFAVSVQIKYFVVLQCTNARICFTLRHNPSDFILFTLYFCNPFLFFHQRATLISFFFPQLRSSPISLRFFSTLKFARSMFFLVVYLANRTHQPSYLYNLL